MRPSTFPFQAVFLLILTLQNVTPAEPAHSAPKSPYFRHHHFVAGTGTGATFEKDIFNAGQDGMGYAARPDPAMRLAYHYNMNEKWSVGLIMHGYSYEFSEEMTTTEGTAQVDFALETSNRGLIVQRYFSRGPVQPYAYGMLALASGDVTATTEGGNQADLDYEGYSFGAGAGILAIFYKYLGVSVDGYVSLGEAEWDETPFSNSRDDTFSPSYWAVTANLVFLIP